MIWESMQEIRERTGLSHDQVVVLIRQKMAIGRCSCRQEFSDYGSVPMFAFHD